MAKKRLYRCFHYFTRGELALWGTSTALILAFFLAYDRTQFGILAASLIGVTSLIFNAKGNPFGQLLMVCFSALYGIISFSCGYYGEMATYLGMTAPMAVFALVSWLRNPYDGNRAEVQVHRQGGGGEQTGGIKADLVFLHLHRDVIREDLRHALRQELVQRQLQGFSVKEE